MRQLIQRLLTENSLSKLLLFSNILTILALTLFPIQEIGLESERFDLPHIDKAFHMFMFFTLTLTTFFTYSNIKLSLHFLLPFLFSVFIEVLQHLMPFGRSFDLFDIIANLVGVLAGLVLVNLKIKSII